MQKKIIPAIIAKTQDELKERINKVKKFSTIIQLDVMDGKFVPNHSLDFDFHLPKMECDCEAHLMVENPEKWIIANHGKVNTILVHFETLENPEEIIKLIKSKGKRAGFVLNPETPVEKIKPYLNELDQVLIMTVNPGAYGSEFLPDMLDKVEQLRELKPNMDIEVDGSINDKTIEKVDAAGANLFVSGSYIVKADDVNAAINNLKALLK